MEAGYIFNNFPIPRMEKPLIKATINGVDYGKRKLFTQKELMEIQTFQQQQDPRLAEIAEDPTALRKDILSFLYSSQDSVPKQYREYGNGINIAMEGQLKRPALDDEHDSVWKEMLKQAPELKELITLEKQLYDAFLHAHSGIDGIPEGQTWPKRQQLAEESPDIFYFPQAGNNPFQSDKARGEYVHHVGSRVGALHGVHSPFLDSGFVFSDNPDVTVNPEKGGVFRVNMMVFHLMSRGLSEMGNGGEKSFDQSYDIKNYLDKLFPKDEIAQAETLSKEQNLIRMQQTFDENTLILRIQKRFLQRAIEWAQSEKGPKEMKELAAKILVKRKKIVQKIRV